MQQRHGDRGFVGGARLAGRGGEVQGGISQIGAQAGEVFGPGSHRSVVEWGWSGRRVGAGGVGAGCRLWGSRDRM
ncbi:hypothetical protein RZS08_03740, partial [Arthrospira platensis SPKY1]|nr:hypothetical protein [Arthrospira platensis SPKY1]